MLNSLSSAKESKRIPDNIPSVRSLIDIGIEVNNPGKSQAELAREIGFSSNQVSMLSMIKKGSSRLKLGRVPKAAQVLKLNPVLLLSAALKERTEDDPEAWEFIHSVINGTHDENEAKILDVIRAVEGDKGERMSMTTEKAARLKEFLETQLFID